MARNRVKHSKVEFDNPNIGIDVMHMYDWMSGSNQWRIRFEQRRRREQQRVEILNQIQIVE